MNITLVDYLNTKKPNQEVIEVATRAFLSELTDDIPPAEVRKRLIEAASDRRGLEQMLLAWEESPEKRLAAAYDVLLWAWEIPEYRERIDGAFKGAEGKLPAIKSALLALIVMYGMYLMVTGGRSSETRTIERDEKGAFKETVRTEYAAPEGPLSVVAKLFGSRGVDD